jgi:alpha-2-macroglobulin
VLAVAALRDVLTAFEAEGLPKPDEMIASVKKDLEMLRRLQNYDGGWGFWKRGEDSWPFLTLHVAHALARAKAKGFDVPERSIDEARPYLKDIERHIPAFYSPESRRALVAYSLYVRLHLGDRDAGKARALISESGGVDKMPLESVAWIYPVLQGDQGSASQVAEIRKLVDNRVEETAAAAHFTTSYSDGNYLLLHSDRRVDALFLEALILDQPKNDVIPKLVEGLLGHRRAGHWASTQEDAWVLLALDKYFNTYEKVTPDFVAKVWLGAQYAGDHAFKGRSTDRHAIDIPMAWLADKAQGTQQLVVAKDGAGRLYYRIGMSYAPTDLRPPPRDNGFVVTREYEAVDDKSDVRRDQDGAWRVKAGARVRVRLTMVAQARRYHVALVDPLPAGLETMNPSLAVTGEVPKDPKEQTSGGYWWWSRPWYEHQNLRDERAEAFTSLLWEGVHTYSYVTRATTPGTFVVPPPKAEEMYHPETFGRGGGDKLIVE